MRRHCSHRISGDRVICCWCGEVVDQKLIQINSREGCGINNHGTRLPLATLDPFYTSFSTLECESAPYPEPSLYGTQD